jgi:Mycothiol maleylpyruvate isomerase N-terminal domain
MSTPEGRSQDADELAENTVAPIAPNEPDIPVAHPYRTELEAERRGWYELVRLVGLLTVDERLTPGYYRDPEWTVRDVVGHLGTWMAQAEVMLEQLSAGTYQGHDVDIDGLNAQFLEAMHGQPWNVAWVQANAGRSRMLEEWYDLAEPSEEAAWWIHKSGAEHYAEHLGRLREWAEELVAQREPEG